MNVEKFVLIVTILAAVATIVLSSMEIYRRVRLALKRHYHRGKLAKPLPQRGKENLPLQKEIVVRQIDGP